LEKHQVWFSFLDDAIKTANFSPLVCIYGEDGQQRGHSLSFIPSERHPERSAGKAEKRSCSWIDSWPP